ncbi:MAG: hypothetical protein AB1736_04010 [Chloroflexota bacterium]
MAEYLEPNMGPLTLIVTALDRDDLVLAGEFEQRVHALWIRPPVRRATFETVLDFGGRRLALCSRGAEPVVVAGAWERLGACAYDASTGERRWQRKDLKRVQRLSPAADGSLAAVGREGAMQILDTATGETVATLRSAEQLWQSRHTATASTSYGNAVTLRNSATWAPLWKSRVPGFAVLSVDFAPMAFSLVPWPIWPLRDVPRCLASAWKAR